MQKSRFIQVAAILSAVLVSAIPLKAQDVPSAYFWISSWKLDRSAWATWEAMIEKHFLPVLEKNLTEGWIIDWGLSARELHSSDSPTHFIWFGAQDKASLLNVTKALEKVEAGLMEAGDPTLSAMSEATRDHADFFVESVVYKAKPGSIRDGYVVVREMQVKPGQGNEFTFWYRRNIQPEYEKLLEKGTIVAFGLDVEEYPTTTPRSRTAWYITPSAQDIDIVDAAFEKHFNSLSPLERQGVFANIDDVIDQDATRAHLERIIRYAASNDGDSRSGE